MTLAVAVPLSVKGMVVKACVTPAKFTVTLNVPSFSLTTWVALTKETIGGVLVSLIVIVFTGTAPKIAFVGLPSVTISVWSPSKTPLSSKVPVIVPVV